MTIVRCPRCRDEVTVPAKATGRALVRCPLCLEQYLLAEALANAPPPLVIIGGEVEQGAIDVSSEGGADYQLADAAVSADRLAPAGVETPMMRRAPAVQTRQRSRRKEKSGMILLVNYVIGGVMGLSLGLLVLWWVFRKDPLELGPPVAAYVPWIVPLEFQARPEPASAGSAKPIDAPAFGKSRQSKRAASRAPSEDVNSELQSVPGFEEPAKLPGATPTPAVDAPSFNERGGADTPNRDDLLKRTGPSPAGFQGGVAALGETATARPMPDLTDLLPDGPFVVGAARKNAEPVVTAAEFAGAVKAATQSLAEYEQIPKDNGDAARQAFVNLYDAASEVGRLISYLNPADADLADSVGHVQTLLDALSGAEGTSRVRPIKFLLAHHWPEERNGQGLLAAGTVKQFQAAGPLFEVTLDASVRDTTLRLQLVTTKDPRDLCKIGDELIALGRVVEQPRESLPGYEGEEPRVLLVGYAVRVPEH